MTVKTSNELNSEKDSSSGVPVLKSYNGYDFDDFETKVMAIQVTYTVLSPGIQNLKDFGQKISILLNFEN